MEILVFGANSLIVEETLLLLAPRGWSFFLVARDPQRLAHLTSRLQEKGAKKVASATADLADTTKHPELYQKAEASLGEISCVFIGHGILGDPEKACKNFQESSHILNVNFLSAVSLLTLAYPRMTKPHQSIACIGSVAGDRGRFSNYTYAAAKGALEIYLSGMRARLSEHGVKVFLFKPGLTDTPMTKGVKKGLLFSSAEKVAKGIVCAMDCGKEVSYQPSYWWTIMMVVRLIPEFLFKKLRF